MSNINGSFGLRPVGNVGQTPANQGLTEYRIATGNTGAIFQGMAVIPLSTGFIARPGGAEGGSVGFIGVFHGCEYTSSVSGKLVWSNTWPGSGADSSYPVKAFVYDNPLQLFVIASDASLTSEAAARAHVFINADFSTMQTGNSTTGMSLGRLDVGTVATSDVLALRIMGIMEDPANSDFTAAGIPVIVRINNHYNSLNGGIAAGTVSATGV